MDVNAMQLSPSFSVDNLNDGIPKSTINIEFCVRSHRDCVAYAAGAHAVPECNSGWSGTSNQCNGQFVLSIGLTLVRLSSHQHVVDHNDNDDNISYVRFISSDSTYQLFISLFTTDPQKNKVDEKITRKAKSNLHVQSNNWELFILCHQKEVNDKKHSENLEHL